MRFRPTVSWLTVCIVALIISGCTARSKPPSAQLEQGYGGSAMFAVTRLDVPGKAVLHLRATVGRVVGVFAEVDITNTTSKRLEVDEKQFAFYRRDGKVLIPPSKVVPIEPQTTATVRFEVGPAQRGTIDFEGKTFSQEKEILKELRLDLEILDKVIFDDGKQRYELPYRDLVKDLPL